MIDLSHLGGSGPGGDPKTHLPDIWGYVCLKYRIKSIIDVGCAEGHNARWFLDRGYDVVGVEGFPDYVKRSVLPRDRIVEHDYTTGPFIPKREFDLGLCTEFVEHVEARFIPNFIATFKRCKFILMSHALPGQGGFHHVTERPADFWEDIMIDAGFDSLGHESKLLQSTYLPHENYGRNTLMLFQRA